LIVNSDVAGLFATLMELVSQFANEARESGTSGSDFAIEPVM
jgi:hypothetical protein